MPSTIGQYHGAQLNLWIHNCPVIASHGMGNTIEIIDSYTEIAHSDGSVDRISTGFRQYHLKFNLFSSVLTPDQHWFFIFNSTAAIGTEVPISLKFALVGSPIEPVLLAGRLRLVAVHNVCESFDFEFTGAPPIPSSPSIHQSVSPTPSTTPTVIPSIAPYSNLDSGLAGEMMDLTVEASPSEEPTGSLSLSGTASIPWSPSESYSWSLSSDPPEEEDYGPSLEERAEQMQLELKKLMEQMEKKGIQPKRRVSFN